MSGLLSGKKLVIAGVITEQSIAFSVARIAQEQGAQVVLTGFGRMSLVERIARRLPEPAPVVELDVTNTEHLDTLAERLSPHLDRIDGLVHSVAFAPQTCLGDNFMDAPWEDVATAVHVSAYSLNALAKACRPLLADPSSIVGLDFGPGLAWPAYNWMGVSKAALRSCAQYLARELGGRHVRVNLVAAGPLRTMAAKSIPGYSAFEDVWGVRAPLGWNSSDPTPAAKACVMLLSDWLPATTAEIIHVDGGFHAMGA